MCTLAHNHQVSLTTPILSAQTRIHSLSKCLTCAEASHPIHVKSIRIFNPRIISAQTSEPFRPHLSHQPEYDKSIIILMNSHNNTHLHSGSPHHSSIQSALDACYRSNRPEQPNLHIQSLRASKIVRAHCNSAAADHSTFCAASSPSLLNFMTLYPPVWPLSPIITPASNSAPALSPDPAAKHGQPTALAQ